MKLIMSVEITQGYEKWKNYLKVLMMLEKNMELK